MKTEYRIKRTGTPYKLQIVAAIVVVGFWSIANAGAAQSRWEEG